MKSKIIDAIWEEIDEDRPTPAPIAATDLTDKRPNALERMFCAAFSTAMLLLVLVLLHGLYSWMSNI